MDKIIFVDALEGEFEFDRTLDFKAAMQQKQIALGVGATLLLSDAKDIVGMLFSVNMNCQGEAALHYSVILTFQVKGWSEEIDESKTESIKQNKEVGKMLEMAVGFIRGSMYVHTKNSPLEGLTIPVLDLGEVLENMKVKKPEAKSKHKRIS